MRTNDVVGFVLMPLVLLVMGWVINAFRLWDSVANYSLPWLCTAIAFALLNVGASSLLMQCPPGDIPGRTAGRIVAGLLLVFGISLVCDALTYPNARDFGAAIGGWLGLGVIQGAAFWLPHAGRKRPAQ